MVMLKHEDRPRTIVAPSTPLSLIHIFGWILSFLYDWIGNYGVVIVLFTIIIRAVLIPLGLKSSRMMVRQQALQPDINEIKRLYPKAVSYTHLDVYKRQAVTR